MFLYASAPMRLRATNAQWPSLSVYLRPPLRCADLTTRSDSSRPLASGSSIAAVVDIISISISIIIIWTH